MFQILIVDDDSAFVYVLMRLLQDIKRPFCVQWAKDGSEALDFLHRRNGHNDASTPQLVLLDFHMPRVNGLDVLRDIKHDPVLRSIPVVFLSASASQDEIRAVCTAHANSFVRKPRDLDQFTQLVKAIESFWMEFAILPSAVACEPPQDCDKGPSHAKQTAEVRSQAMSTGESADKRVAASRSTLCQEHLDLMDNFAAAVKELLTLHEQQFQAIIQNDSECSRFDLLIHMANEKKNQAKYDYLRHVESHGCLNLNAITNTSGT